MNDLFRFPRAVRRNPAIAPWMRDRPDDLRPIAAHWLDCLRGCGDDVRELIHDGHPTSCVADAAFAYVDTFTRHVSVGFFRGADLPDPDGLLEGTGKQMRHVKIRPSRPIDEAALKRLIRDAYVDMRRRIGSI
jgi:hypothetical protein